jgi:hypothetical protein
MMTGPTPCNSNISKLQQEHLLLTPGQAILMQIDLLEPLLLVMQELRLAVLRTAVCARSSNSACCRWRVASTRPLSRSWLHTFRSFTTPRSLFDCLVDRFGKPLRRFNALAPLDARSQRLAAQRDRVAHARRRSATFSTRGCCGTASDFLADSELFADCCTSLEQRRATHALAQRPVGQLQ